MQIDSWSHAISRAAALLDDEELLAAYLGLSTAELSDWKRGTMQPARYVYTRLCALLAQAAHRRAEPHMFG